MAFPLINTGGDNRVGFKVETVVGQQALGVYEETLVTGPTFGYPDSEVVAADTGDQGGPKGRRRIARGADADFPMHFRHGANRLMEEHAFRDDYTPEFSVTFTADGDLLAAGLHQDGSTGPQIKAPLTTFDAISGGVATGCLCYLRDFVAADDNQAMLVKRIWNDGVNDYVDFYSVYAAGAPGDPIGAPKTGELASNGTLLFGSILKNRRRGAPGRRTLTLLVDRFMLEEAARFRACTGWTANDWQLTVADEGVVNCTVTGNGRFWLPASMVPGNGEPAETAIDGSGIPDRQFFVGGEDIELLGVFGWPNAANPTPVPILLGDTGVTNFDFSAAGNNNVLSNILGGRGTVVRRGKFDFTGSFGYFVGDSDVIVQLQRLGDENLHYKGTVNLVFRDPDGYRKALTAMRCEFAQSGGEGGGDGEEVGTVAFGAETLGAETRSIALQEWSIFT